MFYEHNPQGEPQPEKAKLSLEDFRAAVDEYLEGTNMAVLLSQTKLQTDSDGNLEPHVVSNLRKMFLKGDQMSADETVKWKFRQMLDFLDKY